MDQPLTDQDIQRVAEHGDVRAIAAALGIPPTLVARDMVRPILPTTIYQPVRFAGMRTGPIGKLSAWFVTWQCRAVPPTHDGFTYLRIGMSLN